MDLRGGPRMHTGSGKEARLQRYPDGCDKAVAVGRVVYANACHLADSDALNLYRCARREPAHGAVEADQEGHAVNDRRNLPARCRSETCTEHQ